MQHLNFAALIFLSIVAVACDIASVSTATAIPRATGVSVTITAPNLTDTPNVVSVNSPTSEGTLTIPPATWDISYYDLTGTYGGDVTVAIEHWSKDGRYLYVSPQMAGSGGLFWFWRDHIQLIRINLEDGTWIDTNMGSAFSFSPYDRFIAYRREQNVVIHELQTGQERTFTVPSEYGAFGRFVWSQDIRQLIFIGGSVDELESDELSDQANGFSLFLLDTGSMKAQVIIEKDERYLYPLEWQTPTIILLERLYRVASDGSLHYDSIEKYRLNLETKDISKFESP